MKVERGHMHVFNITSLSVALLISFFLMIEFQYVVVFEMCVKFSLLRFSSLRMFMWQVWFCVVVHYVFRIV